MVWSFGVGGQDKLPYVHTDLDEEIQLRFHVCQPAQCYSFLKKKKIV